MLLCESKHLLQGLDRSDARSDWKDRILEFRSLYFQDSIACLCLHNERFQHKDLLASVLVACLLFTYRWEISKIESYLIASEETDLERGINALHYRKSSCTPVPQRSESAPILGSSCRPNSISSRMLLAVVLRAVKTRPRNRSRNNTSPYLLAARINSLARTFCLCATCLRFTPLIRILSQGQQPGRVQE